MEKKGSIRRRLIFTYTMTMSALLLLLICFLIPERVIHERAVRVSRIRMLASILSEDSAVISAVSHRHADSELVRQLDHYLQEYDVDYIVLADLSGQRIYHPRHELIGEYFVGGDEVGILEGKSSYISIARGTANKQQRAFHAVEENGIPVGFVMVSISMFSIYYELFRLVLQLLLVFIIVFFIGFFAFQYVVNSMQKVLLGYEPEEFAKVYSQGEKTLRASTHEFLNKMHVVSGLLQIGSYDEALQYIGAVTEELEENQNAILHVIENPTIAALLLGKSSRAKELNIQFHLRKDSHLRRHTPFLSTSDMITVIGNLVENAFDAVKFVETERIVEIFIGDSVDGLSITVDDTGQGMTPEQIELLYHSSFTTKGAHHGTGLRLIRSIIRRQEGFLEIESELDEGSSFTVSFDKPRKGYL